MLIGPDWNKLYANGQCLYFGVPFNDEQRDALNGANSQSEKDALIRKWREEYLQNRDVVTGELKKEVVEEKKPVIEESIEDVKTEKPAKKKGK